MNTLFTFLSWLVVTFVEGVVLYFFWRWFIETPFIMAPKLNLPQAMGLKVTASIVFPEPLLRQIERKPGKGSPLMDLAWMRVRLASLVFAVGGITKLIITFTVPTLLP